MMVVIRSGWRESSSSRLVTMQPEMVSANENLDEAPERPR